MGEGPRLRAVLPLSLVSGHPPRGSAYLHPTQPCPGLWRNRGRGQQGMSSKDLELTPSSPPRKMGTSRQTGCPSGSPSPALSTPPSWWQDSSVAAPCPLRELFKVGRGLWRSQSNPYPHHHMQRRPKGGQRRPKNPWNQKFVRLRPLCPKVFPTEQL